MLMVMSRASVAVIPDLSSGTSSRQSGEASASGGSAGADSATGVGSSTRMVSSRAGDRLSTTCSLRSVASPARRVSAKPRVADAGKPPRVAGPAVTTKPCAAIDAAHSAKPRASARCAANQAAASARTSTASTAATP